MLYEIRGMEMGLVHFKAVRSLACLAFVVILIPGSLEGAKSGQDGGEEDREAFFILS